MKRVSFKVAKAIKEAGYPQDIHNGEMYYAENGLTWEYNSETYKLYDDPVYCVCPYVLKVWLWLWREKEICIEIKDGYLYVKGEESDCFNDPEEAIIAAIEHLTNNKK